MRMFPPTWRGPVTTWRHPLVLGAAVLVGCLIAVLAWMLLPRWGEGTWVGAEARDASEQESTPMPALVGLPPAPSGPGERMQAGSFKAYGHFALDNDFDGEVNSLGVTAENGARVARYPGTGQPTLADCAGIPLAQWGATVGAEQLTVGTQVCYVTSEDRYGYFTVRDAALDNGKIKSLTCAFVTWRGVED